MKVTHYGEDYCYITIGDVDMECPIAVGKGIDRDRAEIAELKDKSEQAQVQLAGCLVAAEGNATGQNDCEKGAYGWSVTFEATKNLYNQLAEAKSQIHRQTQKIMQRNTQIADLSNRLKTMEGEYGTVDELVKRHFENK